MREVLAAEGRAEEGAFDDAEPSVPTDVGEVAVESVDVDEKSLVATALDAQGGSRECGVGEGGAGGERRPPLRSR